MFTSNHSFIAQLERIYETDLQISKANKLKKDISIFITNYINLTIESKTFAEAKAELNKYFIFTLSNNFNIVPTAIREVFFVDFKDSISVLLEKYIAKNSFYDRNKEKIFHLYFARNLSLAYDNISPEKRPICSDTDISRSVLSRVGLLMLDTNEQYEVFFDRVDLTELSQFIFEDETIKSVLGLSFQGDLASSYYLLRIGEDDYEFRDMSHNILANGAYSDIAYYVLSNHNDLPRYRRGSLALMKTKADNSPVEQIAPVQDSVIIEFLNELLSQSPFNPLV